MLQRSRQPVEPGFRYSNQFLYNSNQLPSLDRRRTCARAGAQKLLMLCAARELALITRFFGYDLATAA